MFLLVNFLFLVTCRRLILVSIVDVMVVLRASGITVVRSAP